jgi:hypothetical protein
LLLAIVLLFLTVAPATTPAVGAGRSPDVQRSGPASAAEAVSAQLTFPDGIARINDTARPNQKLEYQFYGTIDTLISIRIRSEGNRAQFEVRGRNTGAVYKNMNNSPWDGSLVQTQDYVITVTTSQLDTSFTLTVVVDAQRILQSGASQVVTGNVGPGKDARYVLYATAGETLRVLLSSATGVANFAVIGAADGVTYKSAADPLREWSATVGATQDYVLIVSAPAATPFTAEVSRTTPTAPERISFPPGGGSQVRTGTLTPGSPRQYIFNAPAGHTVRVLLGGDPPGVANFQLLGLSDTILYKDLSNPLREFSFTSVLTQDYLITLVTSVAPVVYTLEVTLSPLTPIATPTFIPTATTTPLPVGCVTDGILNGSFEDNSFWILGPAPVPPSFVGEPKYDGLRAVRLGLDPGAIPNVPNRETYSSIRQPFQISPMAGSASLSWWHFDRTEEGVLETIPGGLAIDRQEVILLNVDNSTAGILYRKRLNTSAWRQETIDLTGVIGQPLVLYFNTFNDGNALRTWQFIDKVVLTICYPPTATPTPTSPPTPTPIPTNTPTPTITPTDTPIPSEGTSAATALLNNLTGAGEPTVVALPGQNDATRAGAAQVSSPEAAQGNAQNADAGLDSASLLFGRPPGEVLTFTAVMLGSLALIIMLVWLIRQIRGA